MKNWDDKEVAICGIVVIALAGCFLAGVNIDSIVSHSITAIAGLATGKALTKPED